MLKTKIKRYEFGINVIVLILFALTAAVSLLSAYGGACVCWDPTRWGAITYAKSPPFPPGTIQRISYTYLLPQVPGGMPIGAFFAALNVLTWVSAIFTAFLIYAYLTGFLGKKIWYVAIVNALIGFVAGVIPAVIADTNGFTFRAWDLDTQAWIFEGFSIGSPHWSKVFGNATVLLVLVLILFFDLIKVSNIRSFTAKDNRFSGNVGRQLMLVSFILLWFSAVSFLGTEFMRDAHVVSGVNVWELVDIQSIGAFITLFGGASTLSMGLIYTIYNRIKPPTLVE